MSFAADSIGFFLQLDSAQFNKTLGAAEGKYSAFVASMSKWNQQVYKSSSKGFGALSSLVQSFEKLPDIANKAYTKALSGLRGRMKPLTQKVRLDFSGGADKQIASAVRRSLSSVLRNATIRLSASRPMKKAAIFDTSESLQAAYADMVQPPDYKGRVQGIPKFAKGGEVGGNKSDIDSVLAFLSPGEIVLPGDVSTQLKDMASRKTLPKGLGAAVANIENLAKGLEAVHEAAASGLDPKATKIYHKGIEALARETERLDKTTKSLSEKSLRKMIPRLAGAKKQMKQFTKEGEEAQGVFKHLLTKVIGPVQFLAIEKALSNLSGTFSGMKNAAADAMDKVGGGTDQVQSFGENLFKVNRTFLLSREELFALGEELTAYQRATYGGAASQTKLGEALEAMEQAGAKVGPMFVANTALVATLSETMGTDEGGLAKQVYKLSDAFKWSTAQMEAHYGTVRNIASKTAATVEGMLGQLDDTLLDDKSGFGAYLKGLEPTSADTKRLLGSMAMMQGALGENWVDQGGDVVKMISEGLASPEAQHQFATAFDGMMPKEAIARLMKGDVASVIEALGRGASRLQVDPLLSANIESLSGLSAGTLATLPKQMGAVRKTLKSLRSSFVETGDGAASTADAVGKTNGAFGLFRKNVGLWFGEKLGVRMIEFFDEFNPMALASGVYLAKSGYDFLKFANAGKWFTAVGTKLTVMLPFLTAGTTGFGAALAAAVWPITLVVLAIAAVVGALVWLNRKFDLITKVTTFFTSMWDALKESVSTTWTKSLKPALMPVLKIFGSLWDKLKGLGASFGWFTKKGESSASTLKSIGSAGEWVGKALGAVFGFIAFHIEGLVWVFDKLTAAFIWVSDLLTGHSLVPDLQMLWEIFQKVATLIKDFVQPVIDSIGTAFSAVGDAVGFVWDKVKGLMGTLVKLASKFGGKIIDFVFGEEEVTPNLKSADLPSLTSRQIEQVVRVELQVGPAEEIAHRDMQVVHILLRRLIESAGPAVASPAPASAARQGRSNFANELVRDIARGEGSGS